MSDSVEQKVTRKYVKKPNVVYGRPCINKTPEAIKKNLNAIAMRSYYKKLGVCPDVAKFQKKQRALDKIAKKTAILELRILFKKLTELDAIKINSIIRAINSVIE